MGRTRLLALWIAACLVTAGVAAATQPTDPVVETHDDAAADDPSTTTTPLDVEPSTTGAPTTTSTVTSPPSTASSTTAPPAPSEPDVVTLDQPGIWIVSRDGHEAHRLADVGSGDRRGYGSFWAPDSKAFLGTKSRDGVHTQLVRTALNGTETWYSLPESPPIGCCTPPAPRWISGTDISIGGNTIAFSWMRGDGYAGATIANLDLTDIAELPDAVCCQPRVSRDGRRIAIDVAGKLEIFDRHAELIDGPTEAYDDDGPFELNGVGDWSADGTRVLASGHHGLCALEVANGRCTPVAYGNTQDEVWSPTGHELLLERFDAPGHLLLYRRVPGGDPRLVTGYGSYAEWDPAASRVAFGRSPYTLEQTGRASLHVVDLDDGSEHLLARTKNKVAFPFGWSPDGRWLAVSVGGYA